MGVIKRRKVCWSRSNPPCGNIKLLGRYARQDLTLQDIGAGSGAGDAERDGIEAKVPVARITKVLFKV